MPHCYASKNVGHIFMHGSISQFPRQQHRSVEQSFFINKVLLICYGHSKYVCMYLVLLHFIEDVSLQKLLNDFFRLSESFKFCFFKSMREYSFQMMVHIRSTMLKEAIISLRKLKGIQSDGILNVLKSLNWVIDFVCAKDPIQDFIECAFEWNCHFPHFAKT